MVSVRVRTFTLPHYLAYPVHVGLFTDVANAAFLRSQLLDANPHFDYAFLDASMIISPQHLLSATFLALHNFLTSRPKTRTPHSELVFRLSPNNNIGESYKKFGISDTTTTLIAVKLPLSTSGPEGVYSKDESITNESVSKHLESVIEGACVDIGETGEQLSMSRDVAKIRKVYKLGGGDGAGAGKKGSKGAIVDGHGNGEKMEDEIAKMESVILGIIALKGS
ncbi:CGI-121-domain-containing protein [Pyrenophora tritici-repentis]|uniref:EKC/KEOPS complex subunit CGI121 n=2 Tax=Pyrenophora tritici-repentis TaxID=45151 RepID=A0A2W1EFP8_9PLEO|nr:uncharacterized protein PTRG_10685 [Pyrenophora tritici-repentis Pt-1C-BFP]KAA8621356.1 CGI-121-domain-containing protein [Pyrenophora tritici-repentis]EDU43735.1 hypothetical protein PTRG_10685 [Pyrenophora tritici-repentis Pt-1C-BFP]KAF7450592.1 CGI-121-domain-containing protein [Pyrenophora tritici-repentis]KAF7573209.1 CGI-121 domain containing protein [Pyrenophora tritici-repentis]KAG9381190.1 CGI-121-domain-containing protein [Pyrenophora tritici-repentis]